MGIMGLESEFLLILTVNMVRKYKIRSVIPVKPYMPAPPYPALASLHAPGCLSQNLISIWHLFYLMILGQNILTFPHTG